jgi:hypothetical protein
VADENTTPEETPDAAGPKEAEALKALDEAIAKVQAHSEDNDEQDASRIWERVHQLEAQLKGAPSHAPKDALTGLPIQADGGANLGPADPLVTDPVVTPEESGQAASQPEGTPNLTDETR